jgi:hypothetical protein
MDGGTEQASLAGKGAVTSHMWQVIIKRHAQAFLSIIRYRSGSSQPFVFILVGFGKYWTFILSLLQR